MPPDLPVPALAAIAAPALGLAMSFRAIYGRGPARWLAAGAALAAAAAAVRGAIAAAPAAGTPGWLLTGAAALWIGSALAPGHWRRWPDMAVLLGAAATAGLRVAETG